MVWPIIFGLPSALILYAALLLLRSADDKQKRLLGVPALLLTFASSFSGIVGLIEIDRLSRRTWSDYGFEGRAWLMGFAGFAFALVWLILYRRKASWITLGVAIWNSALWVMVCATL